MQDKASAGKYNGIADVVVKTVRSEGLLAMYQGLESTLWRHILWNAGYFGCISQVRSTLPKAETKRGQIVNDIMAGSKPPLFWIEACLNQFSPLTQSSYRRNRWNNPEHAYVGLSLFLFLFCLPRALANQS